MATSNRSHIPWSDRHKFQNTIRGWSPQKNEMDSVSNQGHTGPEQGTTKHQILYETTRAVRCSEELVLGAKDMFGESTTTTTSEGRSDRETGKEGSAS
uniref:Uncharacterized protein n=1 Tax=Timema shepardi TaxID=629360 RepID=A0A7R9FVG4_TIMSH|nr:unnamed protein product [Timema shepardi]